MSRLPTSEIESLGEMRENWGDVAFLIAEYIVDRDDKTRQLVGVHLPLLLVVEAELILIFKVEQTPHEQILPLCKIINPHDLFARSNQDIVIIAYGFALGFTEFLIIIYFEPKPGFPTSSSHLLDSAKNSSRTVIHILNLPDHHYLLEDIAHSIAFKFFEFNFSPEINDHPVHTAYSLSVVV